MRQLLALLTVLVLIQGFLPSMFADVPETKVPRKRLSESSLLSGALSSLENLLNDTVLDEVVGKSLSFFHNYFGHFKDHSGEIPLEGTQLTLRYNVTHCWTQRRKRLLDFPTITNTCTADLTEIHTSTSQSCTENRQDKALKCAVKKEIQKLIELAQSAQAMKARST